MPRRIMKPTKEEKRLKAFQIRVRQYIRKTPEYKALLELGLIDTSESADDADCQHCSIDRELDSFLYFDSEIVTGTSNSGEKYIIEYEIKYYRIYGYNERLFQTEYHQRLSKSYTMVFYKVTKGILIGIKRLKDIYLNRLHHTGALEEIEFINTLTKENAALHINRKWKYAYTKKLFLDKLKTGITVTEAEIV